MSHNHESDDQLIATATAFELVVRADKAAADAIVIPIIDRAEFATNPMASRFLNLALLGQDIEIIESRGRAFRAGRAAVKALGKLNQFD